MKLNPSNLPPLPWLFVWLTFKNRNSNLVRNLTYFLPYHFYCWPLLSYTLNPPLPPIQNHQPPLQNNHLPIPHHITHNRPVPSSNYPKANCKKNVLRTCVIIATTNIPLSNNANPYLTFFSLKMTSLPIPSHSTSHHHNVPTYQTWIFILGYFLAHRLHLCKQITILMDSGSTHNFVQSRIVDFLPCPFLRRRLST